MVWKEKIQLPGPSFLGKQRSWENTCPGHMPSRQPGLSSRHHVRLLNTLLTRREAEEGSRRFGLHLGELLAHCFQGGLLFSSCGKCMLENAPVCLLWLLRLWVRFRLQWSVDLRDSTAGSFSECSSPHAFLDSAPHSKCFMSLHPFSLLFTVVFDVFAHCCHPFAGRGS